MRITPNSNRQLAHSKRKATPHGHSVRESLGHSMSLNKMKNVFIILSILLFWSCSGKASRIENLEVTTGLRLPEKYEVLKNETQEMGSFGSDFTITIDLKVDEAGLQQIIRQIQNTSIIKAAKSGTWEKSQEGYRFIKDDQKEITTASINLRERRIQYQFTHL